MPNILSLGVLLFVGGAGDEESLAEDDVEEEVWEEEEEEEEDEEDDEALVFPTPTELAGPSCRDGRRVRFEAVFLINSSSELSSSELSSSSPSSLTALDLFFVGIRRMD